MADAVSSLQSGPAFIVTAAKGTTLAGAGGMGLDGIVISGALSSHTGTDTAQRDLQFGAAYEAVEGTPSPPSIALFYPGFWRFRWVVGVGARSLTVYTKQASNVVGGRPSVTLKANASTGLLVDTTTTAGSSTGWIAMTVSFTCTAVGVIWVELTNNCMLGQQDLCICYFDRISVV